MAIERKILKRQSKYKNILKKDYGILTDNKPSKCLMICNAGLVSNCHREYILEVFSNYGNIDLIVMPEGKSYSFLSFHEEVNAITCYESTNGKAVLPCVNGPLYLLFLEHIPQDSGPSNFGQTPPGLYVLENFVTDIEESSLLKCISFDDSQNLGELKNRLVKHYGYEFLYSCNNIDRNSPLEQKIPEECDFLFTKLMEKGFLDLVPWRPDQLTVNQYRPGQGIPSHIDTHSAFEDPILSLSLGSDVVMDFKLGSQTVSVLLPRRSLLIMSGEARFSWSHGISPRKFDVVPHTDGGLTTRTRDCRTSLTFRHIMHTPCACSFKTFCDSQATKKCDISEKIATSLENTYVHEVYNKISEHFNSTRHKPWPNVLEFVQSFPPGSVLVDVGCGNGKYFGHSKNIVEIGLDQCRNLVDICRERGFEALVSNCLSLPLTSQVADGVICIAVIHHLSTISRRIQTIREMTRIVRVGGRILIYVWAKDQSADDKASSYLKQSRKNRKTKEITTQNDTSLLEFNNVSNLASQEVKIQGSSSNSDVELSLPLHENRTSFQHQDLLVPWKLKIENTQSFPTFLRFYHVFEEHELEELCHNIDNIEIDKSYYDQGNWCIILRKT